MRDANGVDPRSLVARCNVVTPKTPQYCYNRLDPSTLSSKNVSLSINYSWERELNVCPVLESIKPFRAVANRSGFDALLCPLAADQGQKRRRDVLESTSYLDSVRL